MSLFPEKERLRWCWGSCLPTVVKPGEEGRQTRLWELNLARGRKANSTSEAEIDYAIRAPYEVNVFAGQFSVGILDSICHSFTMGFNRSLGGCHD